MKSLWVWKIFAVTALMLLSACADQPAGAAPTFTPVVVATNGGPTAAGSSTAAIPITANEGTPTLAGPAQTQTAPAEGSPTAAPTGTQSAQAAPPLDCTSPAALTPAMTEGPYFTPGSPEVTDLARDLPGTKLHLSGYVLTADCRPVPNAKIDLWQTDSQGRYDNEGYTLRGHLFTGPDGSYRVTTLVPGQYPGRTEHIHVKVQAPGGPELTSQLYFPGAAQNESDRIFDPGLLVNVVSENQGEMTATFNFVVAAQ